MRLTCTELKTHLTQPRYCLNIKGIPYRTVWVEAPDIRPISERVGAAPTSRNPDGTPLYTVPMIYDPNTHTAVSDSATIAQYLDKTYPSTPELLPKETISLHAAFAQAFTNAFIADALSVGVYRTYAQQNPRTAERYRRRNEAYSGVKLEDYPKTGSEEWRKHWKSVENALHMFREWIEADGVPGKVLFAGAGGRILYADIIIASWLAWLKRVCGEDSLEWRDVMSWDEGFWATFLQEFTKYEAVDAGSNLEG